MTSVSRWLCWLCWLGPVVLLALWSCSLMGLDDFEANPCRDHLDCEGARRRDPSSCAKYECHDGMCVKRAEKEVCNGEDDDCNGWIDQGVTPSVRGANAVAEHDSSRSVAVATESRSRTTYVVLGGADAEGWIIDGSGLSGSASPLRFNSSSAKQPEQPCPSRNGPVGCAFSEVAVAADDLNLVYAVVNKEGCTAGQLRIGLAHRSASPFSVWLGKTDQASTDDESNIAFGVDVEEVCTGASRGARSGALRPTLGATRPAVASLDTREGASGALAVWLAFPSSLAQSETALCNEAAEVDVEALGVFVPREERGWLDGTDAGRPSVLGRTTSVSSPAVVAIPKTETYIAAFAAMQDGERGVQLISVRSAEKKLDPDPFALDFIADADVAQVTLAAGRDDDGGSEVGLAWTSACGSSHSLEFLTFRTTAEGTSRSDVITIETDRTPLNPQLIHVNEGFSALEPAGGWFLLWYELDSGNVREVKFARIADRDSEWLGQGPLLSAPGVHPVVYLDHDSALRYAMVRETESGTGEIRSGQGRWCDDMD
jgi:hypothetical protein